MVTTRTTRTGVATRAGSGSSRSTSVASQAMTRRSRSGGRPTTATAEANDSGSPAAPATKSAAGEVGETDDGDVVAAPAASVNWAAFGAAIQGLTAMVANLQPPGPVVGTGRTAANEAAYLSRSEVRRRDRARTAALAGGDPPSGSSNGSTGSSDTGIAGDGDGSDDGSGGSDGSNGGGSSSSSSSSDAGDGSDDGRAVARAPKRRHAERQSDWKRGVKDLELPTFSPSPKASVSTWIDRVDLALQGARESGRGKWSDRSLYFILGNKLMDNAARWWVNMNRKLRDGERTWTSLKKALLQRYGEKLDKSAAEWRVNMRMMMPGETYADYAAGLRDVTGRNRVSERVLLAQFYRNLDKSTRQLVKQKPKPKTLEDAVDKATEIDDPMENVAQGMLNIGQSWATAPNPYLVPMAGTTGQTMVIPGVGGTSLPAEAMMGGVSGTQATDGGVEPVALFTNPQGVWNKYSGTWDVPKNRQWNGKFWAQIRASRREKRASPSREKAPSGSRTVAQATKRAKVMRIEAGRQDSEERSSEEEESKDEIEPPAKKRRVIKIRQAGSSSGTGNQGSQAMVEARCFVCGKNGHFSRQCTIKPRCYACDEDGVAITGLGKRAAGVGAGQLRHATVNGPGRRTEEEKWVRPSTVIGETKGGDVGGQGNGVQSAAVEERCEGEDEWPEANNVLKDHPELANELAKADALCDAYFGWDEDVETYGGSSDEAAVNDGDRELQTAAVVRLLTRETEQRDGGRATRYVATLRPAMAAARYNRSVNGGAAVGGKTDASGDRRDTGAGEKAANGGQQPGASVGQEVTTVVERACGSVRAVRAAVHAAKKKSKQWRVERAVARKAAKRVEKRVAARLGATEEIRVEQRERLVGGVLEELVTTIALEDDVQPRVSDDEMVAKVRLVRRRQAKGASVRIAKAAEAEDGLPTAQFTVAGVARRVKLDSGARYSIAGTDWMAWGERVKGKAPVRYVEGISGFLLNVLGVWSFKMRSAYGQVLKVEACVIEGVTSEFLLGVDFMRKHRATMDFDTNEVRYEASGHDVTIPFKTFDQTGQANVAIVRMARKTAVDVESIRRVEVVVAAEDGEQGIFIPKPGRAAVLLAATLTVAKDGKAWVPVMNVAGGRVRLPQKEELGVWVPLEADMQVMAMNGELRRERVRQWLDEMDASAEPSKGEDDLRIGVEESSDRELMLKLLRVYREVLEDKGDCPPVTALDVEHHIDTGSTAPIMQKRRRHAQSENEVIEVNVKKMLDAGVIEEGNGAWGFPVVLVRKKDGEVRFCVDYRALNKVTQRDVYPLPRIDETLEAMGGALLFSTLDLRSGYWQIGVAEDDKDKTAFTTRQGLFRFVRMPFGLANAPSTFQRMMNCVLRGLTWVTCLVYLDDIVVFTKGGIEQHVVELASVLERLKVAGLTLKARKCVFATDSMEYLGHELSPDGVRPLQRLVNAVQLFPAPTDPVEIKRFVHLAGYYRRFVECFGAIMAPLTRLLRKAVPWEWTEDQQFAFERVKWVLTTKPLLIYPDFSLPFRLVTDASTVGLGACLMQDHGEGWQPVGYASKVNDPTVAKYGITDLECLAVVWSVRLFRPYLYGRKFTIITDHAALKWLMTTPELTGRLHRWALTLQEYDFVVEYRPGNTNVVADALSRAPTEVPEGVQAAVRCARRGRRSEASEAEHLEQVVALDSEQEIATITVVAAKVGVVTRAAKRKVEEAQRQTASERGERIEVESERAAVSTEGATAASTEDAVAACIDDLQSTEVERVTHTTSEQVSTSPVGSGGDEAASGGQRGEAVTTAAGDVASRARRRERRKRLAATLQLTDDAIVEAQQTSEMVARLEKAGVYRGMAVVKDFGLALVETERGRRVILPPALWPTVFKEYHDSIWAGHLRGPQTHARIAQLYWWPNMRREVTRWVAGCQECGSRKARPREVIPPLRSLRGGDVGDRWALDVAGPFPIASGGQRYVIAALEYVTRYAVAATVEQHTAENVARFLMNEVVLRFGAFRELLTDGAPELTGKVIERLVVLLQARQVNPVPYRPQMIGLVERFHRTWKDCVSLYMEADAQNDWAEWVKFAVYAYNSGKHSTVSLSPNELMMGRRLRSPNELLRGTNVTEAEKLPEYHRRLLETLERARASADKAREKEQARQARYYNRGSRQRRTFQPGDRVWVQRPPRGRSATKFVHQWMGPMLIVEPAGFDNFLVRREDKDGETEEMVVHCSFMVSYHYPEELLAEEADDVARQLEYEDRGDAGPDGEEAAATVGAATAPVGATSGASGKKRPREAAGGANIQHEWCGRVVEVRRRRRRNKAGNYVLEYQVAPLRGGGRRANGGRQRDQARWISVAAYEELWDSGRVVEDSENGVGV